jgi:diadenosine tetraphosphatase ApaH/serine/threonine PP2A family protein phosphatase
VRTAIFSDTHANLEALTAVLRAAESDGADRYVCLGDTVGYGADPNECCDLVRDRTVVTILGNHDAAVVGRMDYAYYYDAARHALDAHAAVLTQANLRWLRALPYEHRDGTLAFCHSAPIDHEKFEYVFTPEQAERFAPMRDDLAHVTFIGHTHLCRVFVLSDEGAVEQSAERVELHPDYRYVISVGSVGQPRDHDTRAAYGVHDSNEGAYYFRRVPYDIETAARKIVAAQLEPNFALRLFLGV